LWDVTKISSRDEVIEFVVSILTMSSAMMHASPFDLKPLMHVVGCDDGDDWPSVGLFG
jgi:hypothetical protein